MFPNESINPISVSRQAGWRLAGLRQAGWLEVMGTLALLVPYWGGYGSPGFTGTALGAVGALASLVLHWGAVEALALLVLDCGTGSLGFTGSALGRLWEPWLYWYCTGGGGCGNDAPSLGMMQGNWEGLWLCWEGCR